MSLLSRLTLNTFVILSFFGALYSYLLYHTQKQEFLNGIDKQLISGTTMARAILGNEYHDSIQDKNSVSLQDYLHTVDTYNHICLESGFQYLWSNLFLEDGTIVFTSGTSASKDVTKGDHAMFFDPHSDPMAFSKVIQSNRPTFSNFHNEWGDGRMLLVPYKDGLGRVYVIGASVPLMELDERLEESMLKAIAIFFGMLVIGLVISYLFAKTIVRPLYRVREAAASIASGDHSLRLDETQGGHELQTLASDINMMNDAIFHNSAQLKAREHQLNTIVENLPHMLFLKDAKDLRFVMFNRAGENLLGISRHEMLGKNDYDFFPKEQADFFTKKDREVINSGKAIDISKEPIDTPRGKRILHTRKVVVKDEQGTPLYLLGISEDITDIEKIEERYRLSMDAIKDGLWDWDIPAGEVYYSPAWSSMLGESDVEALYESWEKRIHPKDKEETLASLQKHLLNETPSWHSEHRLKHNDGRWIWVLGRGKIVQRDSEGKPLRMIGTMTNITEIKKIQEQLSHFNQKLEKQVTKRTEDLLQAQKLARMGSWSLDMVDDTLWWSDELYHIFEKEKGVFFPSYDAFMDIIHPDDRETVSATYKQCLQTHDPYRIVHRLLMTDGRIKYVEERCNTFFDDEGKAIHTQGVVHDITETKLNEIALTEAKEIAEEATKTKSNFLANMSHEIRTPMNAIIGMTELALGEPMQNKPKHYIKKVQIAAQGLLGIINDILDFSKIEAGKLEMSPVHFQLKDAISPSIDMVKKSGANKELKTRVKIDHDVPRFYYADSLRLGQVLTNLLSNAAKFSPEGSSVTLRISLLEESDTEAHLQFSVEDKGIGISQEHQKKLFQPFSQADESTSRRYGGTGLGLIISKRIVEQMNGKIWVESQEGEGSTFFFQVRMLKSGEDAIIESTQDIRTSMKLALGKIRGARILLVEDNELNQELAIDLLETNGFHVTVANNGQEALDILKGNPFDGVLMDCHMPIMDGYEATRIIRSQDAYRELPILAMTANVMEKDREKAFQSGMNDYIIKPINPPEMFTTMAKWIAHKE